MYGEIGDHLVIHGRLVDDPTRVGTIVGVLGAGGDPAYRVRFPDGRETVIFPGPDAEIRPQHG